MSHNITQFRYKAFDLGIVVVQLQQHPVHMMLTFGLEFQMLEGIWIDCNESFLVEFRGHNHNLNFFMHYSGWSSTEVTT